MLSFPCDTLDCTARTRPFSGRCMGCRKHLCLDHLEAASHECGNEGLTLQWDPMNEPRAYDAENARMQTIIEGLGIVETAQKLRPGHSITPTSFDISKLPRGNYNFHVPVEFDDGVRWIARIRRKGVLAVPSALTLPYMQGEIDAMRWLGAHAAAPVPEVVSSTFTHGEAEFYYMTMVSGAPLPDINEDPLPTLSTTIMDYAKINVTRSQHPLRLIGTVYHNQDTGEYHVGPNINPFVADVTPPLFPGPWKTAAEKYRSRFEHVLSGVLDGSMYPDRREEAFLVYRWMKDAVMAYPPYNMEGGETFVVHEDSNEGHIMIDTEGRIQGLIDWERASVSVACEAFSTPQAFENFSSICKGSNELSSAELELAKAYNDLGRPDLAECLTSGKPFQWLSIVFGSGMEWADYGYIRALGESLGLKMEADKEEFLKSARVLYGAELV